VQLELRGEGSLDPGVDGDLVVEGVLQCVIDAVAILRPEDVFLRLQFGPLVQCSVESSLPGLANRLVIARERVGKQHGEVARGATPRPIQGSDPQLLLAVADEHQQVSEYTQWLVDAYPQVLLRGNNDLVASHPLVHAEVKLGLTRRQRLGEEPEAAGP